MSRSTRIAACVFALAAPSAATAGQANLHLPAETVAFEDVATTASDADHNDVVVRWNKRCVVDDGGVLQQEVVHLVMLAAGASHTNQLRLGFAGTPDTVTMALDGGAASPVPVQADGTAVLASDVRDLFDTPPTGFVNTQDDPVTSGRSVEIVATYTAGPSVGSTCAPAQFTVHRTDPPATIDETTRLAANDQPLLVRVPATWEVPLERVRIETAYPDFMTWVDATLGGCSSDCAGDGWYDTPSTGDVLPRPSLADTSPLPDQPTCSDGVHNQDETDTDCGGEVCGGCAVAASCTVHDDCTEAVCDGGTCALAATCDELHTAQPDLGDGAYTIQPSGSTAFDAWCDMTIDDGGWTLVVHQDTSATWAGWHANLSPSYSSGTYVADPTHPSDFYRRFDDLPHSELLFATGDRAYWLVTSPGQVACCFSNALRRVYVDSTGATNVDYRWYHRSQSSNPEDPWISIGHHVGTILYGEAGYNAYNEPRRSHGGANVFVR